MDKPFSLRRRGAGVLLHLTSLPGPHGIGDLGAEALRFVQSISACGQTWWQMLPIGPVGGGDSPYASPSAFAGSPLLINLAKLGPLLEATDLRPVRGLAKDRVHYPTVARFKESRLRKAFLAFERVLAADAQERTRFDAFCEEQHWLGDYALFCALKERYQGAVWTDWPEELRSRRAPALEQARKDLAPQVRYHEFLQYQFAQQWAEFKRACGDAGVGLIGDIPIFMAHDSADVWSRPELFYLDEGGRPTVVAGVPPDYFSKTGQLWGNPLYRWDELKEEGYNWWLDRLRMLFSRFDAVRIDHFIAFQNYWEIPGDAKDAVSGRWMPGPGADFFERVRAALGDPEIIAEDLGLLTPEVAALRDRFDLPGMSVVQFAFSAWDESRQPHRFKKRGVVYSGTHDNDTTAGWFHDPGGAMSTRTHEQIGAERENALRYLGTRGAEIHWDIVRLAMKSPADTAIIPVQDLLGLGSEARMNLPGTTEGNWQWRLQNGAWTPEVAGRLGLLTGAYGRGPEKTTS